MASINSYLYKNKEYESFYDFAKQCFNYDIKHEREVLLLLKNESILKYLSQIATHSQETYQHSVRVAILCSYIARQSGMTKEGRDKLIISALLHDYGKIKIPIDLLSKTGTLSDEDWALLHSHPLRGYRALKNDFPKDILEPILYHHKKLDGDGYPEESERKKPHILSTNARILTVADIYDALTSPRTYKRPLTKEKALIVLKKDAKKGKIEQEYVDILEKYVKQ